MKSQKAYKERNKSKVLANNSKYRASRLKAAPPWLSKSHEDEITYLYSIAKDAELLTGDKYHVDHITPLRGKNVCGLHVPWNLQVLRADLNLTKGNN